MCVCVRVPNKQSKNRRASAKGVLNPVYALLFLVMGLFPLPLMGGLTSRKVEGQKVSAAQLITRYEAGLGGGDWPHCSSARHITAQDH